MNKNINLDAPAFGPGSQPAASEVSAESSQDEKEIQDKTESEELVTHEDEVKEPIEKSVKVSEEESEEEQKIPYSRFKTIAEQKRKAEQDALEANERYERLLNLKEEKIEAKKVDDDQLWSYYVKLYGDNDASREAYKVELQRIAYIEKKAEERALHAVQEARKEEIVSLQKNEEVIDNNLEDLSSYLGRRLTEDEEVGILSIVDEYTPKDEDGNYSGDLLPFDKAFEIYQLKNQTKSQASKKARSTATNLTSRNTSGEISDSEKVSNDFNPLDWNAYRRRV